MTRVTIYMTDPLKVFLEEERKARGFDDVSGFQSLLTEAQARTGMRTWSPCSWKVWEPARIFL